MGSVLSIDDVMQNLKNAHDGATIEAVDLRDDSDDQPDFREALERLRDSTAGGFVLLLCSEALSCEQVAKKFEHLTHCFPVLDSRADDVEEGKLWAAVVAGTRGAPGIEPDSVSLLRAGELGHVPDATLEDLDLSLVGIRWPVPQSNKVWRKSVLRMIRQGIATQVDGKLRPTVAGLVALGRRPQTFLPGMRIELNTGVKEVCWRGSLPALLQKARYYRQPRLASMPFALEEIVLNALLHRDWRPRYHNEPIRISFLERELVCTNPGLLDEDWRIGKSMPPNSALHALVRRLRPSETGDPGLQRIDAVLSGMELRPVTLHAKKNWIKTVVPWTEAPPSARTDSSGVNAPHTKSRNNLSTHPKARQESSTSNTARSQTQTSPERPNTPMRPPHRVHRRDAYSSQGNVSCEKGRASPVTGVGQIGMPPVSAPRQDARQQTQNPFSQVPHQLAWTTAAPSALHIPPSEQAIRPAQSESPAPATLPLVHGCPDGTYVHRHNQVPIRVPPAPIYAQEPTHPIREPAMSSLRSDLVTGGPSVQRCPAQEPPAAMRSPVRPTLKDSSNRLGPNEAASRPRPTRDGARPVEPRRSTVQSKEVMGRRIVPSNKEGPTNVGTRTYVPASSDQREAQTGIKRKFPQPSVSQDSGRIDRSVPARPRDDTTGPNTTDVVGPVGGECHRQPGQSTRKGHRIGEKAESVRDKAGARRGTPNQSDTIRAKVPTVKAKTVEPTSPSFVPPKNERDEAVIRRLRKEGPQTTKQLMKALRCTRWAIRTTLDRLMAANIVKAAAASSTSPNQTYELV